MLLSFSLLLSSVCIVSVSAELEDYEQNRYRQELLEAIGMDIQESEEAFTRKEAAKSLSILCGLTMYDSSPVFSDVAEDDPYAGYISSAYAAGVVSGYSDTEFRPDAQVTYMELCVMALNGLGYKKYAEACGGYPKGYRKIIDDTDIAENIPGAALSDTVTFSGAITVLFNTLHTKVMGITGISNGELKYRAGDKTLLSGQYDIELVTGVMTANSRTRLYDAEENSGSVCVNGEKYTAKPRYDKYLGYTVNAYIRANEEAVYIYPDRKNTVLTVKGDDVLGSTSKQALRYEDENGRTRTAKIMPAAGYFYNGVYETNMETNLVDTADLMLANAEYTLLDNNDDGIYDFIFADKYVYLKIKSTDRDKLVIYDDFSDAKIEMNADDSIVFADGNEAEFSVLKYNDILACRLPHGVSLQSRNSALDFILLDKTVYGKVTGIHDDYVVIDKGEEYKINSNYGLNADELYGKTGLFYLDANDKIITKSDNTVTAGEMYAFIVKIIKDENDDKTLIKLMTENGVIDVINARTKIHVFKGETQYSNTSEALFNNKSNYECKLVKITLSEGEISKITLPSELSYGHAGDSSDTHNMIAKKKYTTRGAVLDDTYRLTNDTKVFSVPNDLYDFESYAVTPPRGVSISETNFEVELYGVDENYTVSAMLLRKKATGSQPIKADGSIFVVNKTYTMLDENDEITVGISGMKDGEIKSYVFSKGDLESMTWQDSDGQESGVKRVMRPAQLQRGDIILLTAEGDKIMSYRVLLDRSSDTDFACSCADEHKDGIKWDVSYPFTSKASIYTWGEINKNGGEYLTYTVSSADKNIWLGRVKNIYLVEEKDVSRIQAMDGELKTGRRVFVFYSWGTERDLVVYR